MSKNIILLFVIFIFSLTACSTVEEVRDTGSTDTFLKDVFTGSDSFYDTSEAGSDSLSDISISDTNPCDGVNCSGHGRCVVQRDGAVCICDKGYSPGDSSGLTCVPTSQVCVGGPIDYDVDNDGKNDSWFEPNEWECLMYELVNRTRASHNDEGTPECHKPLLWSVEWSAHGRNHSYKMKDRGGLFHEDYPWGQNCAYGCDPACEMNMYMNGPNEGHCDMLSHHCNIMRCGFTHIGIGYVDTWNTQNFY